VVNRHALLATVNPSRPTTSPQAQPVSRSHPIGVSQVRSRVNAIGHRYDIAVVEVKGVAMGQCDRFLAVGSDRASTAEVPAA
jgi:hypothetical protein